MEHHHEHKGENIKDERVALLDYMHHHNSHHVDELAGMLSSLSDLLDASAMAEMNDAIADYKSANAHLKNVLDSIDK